MVFNYWNKNISIVYKHTLVERKRHEITRQSLAFFTFVNRNSTGLMISEVNMNLKRGEQIYKYTTFFFIQYASHLQKFTWNNPTKYNLIS